MAALSVQPFEPTPSGYAEITALWNAMNPEWPRRAEIWQRVDAGAHAEALASRRVARRDDRLVALGEYCDPPQAGAGTFELSFCAAPDTAGPEALALIYAEVEPLLAARSPERVLSYVRDTRPWMVAFYETRGFEVAQQTAYSVLDVAGFDATPHAERMLAIARAGYRIRAARELDREGSAWRQAYHALDARLLEDVPFLGGLRPVPFEDFTRDLDDPDRYNLDATFVAYAPDAGAPVGASRLSTPPGLTERAFAALTGVDRAHRRRGLATALKLATIAYAREHGFRWITSLNEADNPMLGLNHALGFETRYTQLTMQRRIPQR